MKYKLPLSTLCLGIIVCLGAASTTISRFINISATGVISMAGSPTETSNLVTRAYGDAHYSGGGGGSQTPILSDIDYALYSPTNLGTLSFTSLAGIEGHPEVNILLGILQTNGQFVELIIARDGLPENRGVYVGNATYSAFVSHQVMADAENGTFNIRQTWVSGNDDTHTMRWRPWTGTGHGGGRLVNNSDAAFLTYDNETGDSWLSKVSSITGPDNIDLTITTVNQGATPGYSLNLTSGNNEGIDDSGRVHITTGKANDGNSGNIDIETGISTNGVRGTVNILVKAHILDAIDTNSPITLSQLNNTYRTSHTNLTIVATGTVVYTFSSPLESTSYAAYLSSESAGAISYSVGTKTVNDVTFNILSAFTGNIGMSVFMDK